MFRSISQQNVSTSIPHVPTSKPSKPNMSTTSPRRPQLSHSQTLSSFPESHKRSKTRPTGSFLTSFLATFTPTTTNPTSDSSTTLSSGLKQQRSEMELRKDYLSPEREKEIGEIWETFKRQSHDIHEDKLTSFPCITEYEYEDQEDESRAR